jgi:hypothetical protein
VEVENVAGDLQFVFVQAYQVAVAAGQPVAPLVADPEPDVVADDGGGTGNEEDDPGVEAVGVTGVGAATMRAVSPGTGMPGLSPPTRRNTAM